MQRKILAAVRVLSGLEFTAFFVWGLVGFQPPEGPPGAMALSHALTAAGYFNPMIYLVYLLVGAAYIINRFVPLATIVLTPLTVNIVLFHIFLFPTTLPRTAIVVVPNLVMIYACWEAYRPLWRARS